MSELVPAWAIYGIVGAFRWIWEQADWKYRD